MTPKMSKFVAGIADGLTSRAAGLAAGYSAATVDQAVSRLLKRPDVKKAIKTATKQQSASNPAARNAPKEDDDADKLRTNYKDSLEFMRHAMNNPKLAVGLRFEAAKQLLPYEHARIGEKGKKEAKKEDAHEANKGKFKTKAPPRLSVVK